MALLADVILKVMLLVALPAAGADGARSIVNVLTVKIAGTLLVTVN